MTDAAGHHGSLINAAKSGSRLRKRRNAVRRLQFYGIAAIAISGLALFSLLYSVVSQAAGVLTESYLVMPVTLAADELDPDGSRDPKTLLRADYNGLYKDMLKQRFPDVTGRSEKREMYDIISGGAPFELAEKVSTTPALIGSTIDYPFLASDITDLYLKGSYGRLRPVDVQGALTIEDDGSAVTITSSEPDFEKALEVAKARLSIEASRLRRQAAMQNNGVQVFQRRAENAETEEARAENERLAAERSAQRDQMLAAAETLEARAAGTGGDENLDRDNASLLIRAGGGWIKLTRIEPDMATGEVIIAPSDASGPIDDWQLLISDLPEAARKISDLQIALIEDLRSTGAVDQVFNWRFFVASDSREPELAGIWGAAVGSFWTMLVTFLLAFPVGVSAAIYLQEFAPKNRFTDFIEVNINNLAAVPSIVFGLLGLAVFLGFFGVPRSSPLAGGIVLALMTLPTIIIASRAAIRAVPPSIRDAALGVGASRLQSTFHHVLPLAMPGVLTGTIIGMAQALGETAPLIMIGMVAFIVDIPSGITDSATVLPVQVYRWSDFPERAFEAKTGAAICVLLAFLVIMNTVAVILRRRFERRW